MTELLRHCQLTHAESTALGGLLSKKGTGVLPQPVCALKARGDATTPVLSQPRVRNALKTAIIVLYAGLEQSKSTVRQHLSEYHPKTKRALIGLEPWQREDRARLRACSGSRLTCAERDRR
ncbi:hypothetical protein J6590_098667 [Homalodisca vitripennis]|nr:hypothetical protein J6590_098667 [Homalodisca vitripennis]